MPLAARIYRPLGFNRREQAWISRQVPHRHWYNLTLWRGQGGLRLQQLARQPLCEECQANGFIVIATDVDHRVAHKGNWDLFIDPSNHRSLCHPCHSRKTRTQDMPQA